MMEIWSIERHLGEFAKQCGLETQAIFVAPSIYADSQRQIDFVKFQANRTIRPYPINEFVDFLNNTATLYI